MAGTILATIELPETQELARTDSVIKMESTRDRILRIATDLFVENGFQGTGLAELSEAVGLGRGGLYHHIHSKDQLHADIAFAPIRAAVEEAHRIGALDESPESTVMLLSAALAGAIRFAMNPWIVFFREFSSLPATDQEGILALRMEYLEEWRTAIERGVEGGKFINEPPMFLDGVLPMFIYAHIWETNRMGSSKQDLGESLGQFILRGLRK